MAVDGALRFVHFGMNTMTGLEWGLGGEDPVLFDPQALDVEQWMRAFVSAGMSAVVLTAKHHDGFCLWPTGTTDHSVAASPWREGKGDLVRDVAEAAERNGLRLGIYLSPWDRNHPTYGQGVAYDDVFVRQLTELLSGYGPVFSVWFDGANGEGADGRVQEYDWDRYYAVVRELQPQAAISVCGPDVRWCGNEAGHTRPEEWSVVRRTLRDVERIADKSQKVDDGAFSRAVHSDDEDLGSRAVLSDHLDDLIWYPAEVNTSIRPGWFYHPEEDDQVRSGEELFAIWSSSVGGNANFLLNVPPRADGTLAEPDVRSLAAFGDQVRALLATVVTGVVSLSSGELPVGLTAADLQDPHRRPGTGAWSPSPDDSEPTVRIAVSSPQRITGVVLREDITEGQRIEQVVVYALTADGEVEIARTGCIGYQRLVRFDPVSAESVRLTVTATRDVPRLSVVSVVGMPSSSEPRPAPAPTLPDAARKRLDGRCRTPHRAHPQPAACPVPRRGPAGRSCIPPPRRLSIASFGSAAFRVRKWPASWGSREPG